MWKKPAKKAPKAKKKAQRPKSGRSSKAGGAGGMIFVIVVVFIMVVGLMIWVQGLFDDMNRRLVETSKRVEMIAATRASAPASAEQTASATAQEPAQAASANQSEPAEEPAADLEVVIGRVVSVKEVENFWNVTIDPAQLLSGKAASTVAARRGSVPVNGRFLDDPTRTTREIPCSVGAPITGLEGPDKQPGPKNALDLFKALEGEDSGHYEDVYFQMTIDSDFIVGFEVFSL